MMNMPIKAILALVLLYTCAEASGSGRTPQIKLKMTADTAKAWQAFLKRDRTHQEFTKRTQPLWDKSMMLEDKLFYHTEEGEKMYWTKIHIVAMMTKQLLKSTFPVLPEQWTSHNGTHTPDAVYKGLDKLISVAVDMLKCIDVGRVYPTKRKWSLVPREFKNVKPAIVSLIYARRLEMRETEEKRMRHFRMTQKYSLVCLVDHLEGSQMISEEMIFNKQKDWKKMKRGAKRIKKILDAMGLPKNYEWPVKSQTYTIEKLRTQLDQLIEAADSTCQPKRDYVGSSYKHTVFANTAALTEAIPWLVQQRKAMIPELRR